MKKRTKILIIIIFALMSLSGFSQTNPKVTLTGTSNQATIYKGAVGSNTAMVLPLGTHDPIYPDLPLKGRIQLNDETNKLEVHNGTEWVELSLSESLKDSLLYMATHFPDKADYNKVVQLYGKSSQTVEGILSASQGLATPNSVTAGAVSANNVYINQATPVNNYDATRKDYVDNLDGNNVKKSGVSNQTITGNLGIVGNANVFGSATVVGGNLSVNSGSLTVNSGITTNDQITIGAAIPTADNHAARKDYVDNLNDNNVKLTGETGQDIEGIISADQLQIVDAGSGDNTKMTSYSLTATTTNQHAELSAVGGLSMQNVSGSTFTTIKTQIVPGPSNTLLLPVVNGTLATEGFVTNITNNKADLVAGKVPLSQINDALLGAVNYQGTYNAATNTPTLPTAIGNKGFYYVINTTGTVSGTSYEIGDWIISNGTTWDKVTQTFPVNSLVIDGSNNAVSGNAVYDALSLKANTNGSNTYGTWPVSITGDAANSSNWGGRPADWTPTGVNLVALNTLGGLDNFGTFRRYTPEIVKPWLGITTTDVSGLSSVLNGKPNLDGAGAYGTWAINITGNAAGTSTNAINWLPTFVSDLNTPTGFKLLQSTVYPLNLFGSAYNTGIQFSVDNNPGYANQLVFDIEGSLGTRTKAAGNWGNWSKIPFDTNVMHITGNEIKNGSLTIDNVSDSFVGGISLIHAANPSIGIYSKTNSSFPLIQLVDSARGGKDWNIENGRSVPGTLGFYSTDGSQVVSILQNGNTGIGTTNPDIFSRGYDKVLGIAGGANTSVSVDGSSQSVIDMGNGNTRNFAITTTPTETAIATIGAKPLQFYTDGVLRQIIAANGNVGIGTTNPETKLDVWSNTASSDLISGRIGSLGVQAFTLGGYNDDVNNAGLTVKTKKAGVMTEAMRILANGNVGINETAPTEKFYVNGNSTITGNLTTNSTLTVNGNGYSLAQFQNNGSNRGFIGQGDYAVAGGNPNGFGVSAINDLQLSAGNALRTTIKGTTGNVLIGTVVDSNYKLDVNGTARFNGEVTIPNGTASTSAVNKGQLDAVAAGVRPSYRVYSALMYQNGTDAPVATVLENTTGATITWARSGSGLYTATASSAIFTYDKTAWMPIATYNNTTSAYFASINSSVANMTTLRSGAFADGVLGNGNTMGRIYVEIRIYN